MLTVKKKISRKAYVKKIRELRRALEAAQTPKVPVPPPGWVAVPPGVKIQVRVNPSFIHYGEESRDVAFRITLDSKTIWVRNVRLLGPSQMDLSVRKNVGCGEKPGSAWMASEAGAFYEPATEKSEEVPF